MTKITYRRQRVYYDRNTREFPTEMAEAKHHHGRHQTPSERRFRRIVRDPGRADAEFAESYLQIARLLLAYGKTEVARRRLKRVVDKFGTTPAACESRNLLTTIAVGSSGSVASPAHRAAEAERRE